MLNKFAVFICTYGRPDKQLTLSTLKKCGYSGKIYMVLDDTDATIQQYINNYGPDNIIVFDKQHYINSCKDTGDNVGHYKCILYAKNAVEDMAQRLGLGSFMLVDDDITGLRYRYVDGDTLRSLPVKNLDDVLNCYNDFLLNNNVTTLGFCGATHFMGGVSVYDNEKLSNNRFPYQVYLRNTSTKVDWISWYGEDDITMVLNECKGQFWLNLPFVQYDCVMVGDTSKTGGMVDEYKNNSSYKLNYIKKQQCPSQLTLRPYKDRYLTTLRKDNACVKLISDYYKKEK